MVLSVKVVPLTAPAVPEISTWLGKCKSPNRAGANLRMSASFEKKFPSNHQSLKRWLQYAKPSQQKFQQGLLSEEDLTPKNRLSQINVIQQLEHLKTYPYIEKRLQTGTIKIDGWWFDIKTANLYRYDPKVEKFILTGDEL